MIRLTEVKFDLNETFNEEKVKQKVAKKLRIKASEIDQLSVIKESIDARKGITFSYTVDVSVKDEGSCIQKGFKKSPEPYMPITQTYKSELSNIETQKSPIIIGFGPAGMFAGLLLAEAGLNPIILEMGGNIASRDKAVDLFWSEGILDPDNNVQFGAGGAGTYSDGKLTTRIKDERIHYVIEKLIENGAPEEIRYKNKPHIGTDKLKTVVNNIEQKIIAYGGTVKYHQRVTDISVLNGKLKSLCINDKETIQADQVILAVGHSARSMFEVLVNQNIQIEQKPYAIGVRIEHPQKLINISQYGSDYDHERLGAADYKLTYQTKTGRSVYSFCMCPGGSVVASASEKGGIVVNGMSEYARDTGVANSALLVNVAPEDYKLTGHLLDGMYFQRRIEQEAYRLAGNTYNAPSQTIKAFLEDESRPPSNGKRRIGKLFKDYDASFNKLKASYTPNVTEAPLKECLPDFIYEAIKEALPKFGNKIPGFDDDRAIITGVETRSSSPIRIIRDSVTLESINTQGLYPCGEGAGYAGGITSSAVDGIKVAESIIKKKLGIVETY